MEVANYKINKRIKNEMKHLLLFEAYDMVSHLKHRGIDPDKTQVVIDEKTQDVYFYLFNMSGQMVGFQKYNPNYPKQVKNGIDPRLAKYFTWVTDEGNGKKIAVWGLETIDMNKDEFFFITEGIFDIARIHEAGYPGIAVLCNDPSESLKNWLYILPQKKIVIYDNDKAGVKLKKIGDLAFTVPTGKDMNDLTPSEAKSFLQDCINKI